MRDFVIIAYCGTDHKAKYNSAGKEVVSTEKREWEPVLLTATKVRTETTQPNQTLVKLCKTCTWMWIIFVHKVYVSAKIVYHLKLHNINLCVHYILNDCLCSRTVIKRIIKATRASFNFRLYSVLTSVTF